MWHEYLNNEIKYTSIAPFMDVNDQAFLKWNFDHTDPTGAQTGGDQTLYTAGDLAAAIAVNPYLKLFSANGYYDAVTPCLQYISEFRKYAARREVSARSSYYKKLSLRAYDLS